MAAEDYALPPAFEARLREVCERQGVPARQYDAIRQLLSTSERDWPVCCRGSCAPCVDEHKSIAREVLLLAREAAGSAESTE